MVTMPDTAPGFVQQQQPMKQVSTKRDPSKPAIVQPTPPLMHATQTPTPKKEHSDSSTEDSNHHG
jgi:hypothetical protein